MEQSWERKSEEKIVDPKDLEEKVGLIRKDKKTIATLNGSFDLLHAGHLEIIYQASMQADVLIMALNSDESIKEYKSLSRPIIPLKYRLQMVSAIEFVDYVTWFDETTPCRILEEIKPDVHVNGDTYGEDCIEAKVIKKYNGRIHLVKLVPSLSTSNIIKKIVSCV